MGEPISYELLTDAYNQECDRNSRFRDQIIFLQNQFTEARRALELIQFSCSILSHPVVRPIEKIAVEALEATDPEKAEETQVQSKTTAEKNNVPK